MGEKTLQSAEDGRLWGCAVMKFTTFTVPELADFVRRNCRTRSNLSNVSFRLDFSLYFSVRPVMSSMSQTSLKRHDIVNDPGCHSVARF